MKRLNRSATLALALASPALAQFDFAPTAPVAVGPQPGGVATGDLDGDGDTDLVASRRGGGLEVYLQTPDGEFYRETGDELATMPRVFDVKLLDLDGDGRDDIVAGCVPEGDRQGGVFVWLSRPNV